jgi:hypothetical protein
VRTAVRFSDSTAIVDQKLVDLDAALAYGEVKALFEDARQADFGVGLGHFVEELFGGIILEGQYRGSDA